MKKTQNRIISPHAGWRLCLYVMLVMFASCKSCKKEINLLPDETQTGANTFGCLVDGKAWIPDPGGSGAIGSKPINGGYLNAPIGAPASYGNNNVWLRIYQDNATISFYIRNVDRVGTYPLNFYNQPEPASFYPQNYGEFVNYYTGGADFYMTNSTYTGSVEITRADRPNAILSGRFSFTGVSSTGKTIKVTDGRFDINQRTQ